MKRNIFKIDRRLKYAVKAMEIGDMGAGRQ